jgi:hypothetical protein
MRQPQAKALAWPMGGPGQKIGRLRPVQPTSGIHPGGIRGVLG